MKANEIKWDHIKWKKMKWTEMKWNKIKQYTHLTNRDARKTPGRGLAVFHARTPYIRISSFLAISSSWVRRVGVGGVCFLTNLAYHYNPQRTQTTWHCKLALFQGKPHHKVCRGNHPALPVGSVLGRAKFIPIWKTTASHCHPMVFRDKSHPNRISAPTTPPQAVGRRCHGANLVLTLPIGLPPQLHQVNVYHIIGQSIWLGECDPKLYPT